MGLGRSGAGPARGRQLAGVAKKTAAPGKSQRLFIHTRPDRREDAARKTPGEKTDVGEGNPAGRTPCNESESNPDGRGQPDLSGGGRGGQLLLEFVQPCNGPVLREHSRK